MSTTASPFALVAHRLSGGFRARFEEAIGLSPAYVDLGALGRLRQLDALRALRSFRGARCFLPLEHDDDAPLVPLLETAALVAGARAVEIVFPDLHRAGLPRRKALSSAAALAAASLDGKMAMRRCGRELDELLAAGRLDFARGADSRALLLYSSFWFFHRAGAPFARLAGVANGLVQAGYEVELASTIGSLPVQSGVELHRLQPPGTFATPYEVNPYRFQNSVVHTVQKLAAGRRFAFVYERKSRGSYAGVVLSRRLETPLVLEYNFPSARQAEDWATRLRDEELAERAEQVCLQHAHLVLTITEPLRDEVIARGVPPERVVLHLSGVDATLFDPSRFGEDDRLRVRNELRIPRDAVVVSFSGSFREVHGVEQLAEAVQRMATKDAVWLSSRRVHFLLIGDGPKLEDVRKRLSGLRFATLTGLVPLARMPEYLAASDILVAPFKHSSVGLSPAKLFEYMAMGKPIVASDVDQIGHVLRPALRARSLPAGDPPRGDEELAVLVRPGECEDLVRAIRFLVDRPSWRAALGGRAREELIARYTWRHQMEAILARLEELAGSAR